MHALVTFRRPTERRWGSTAAIAHVHPMRALGRKRATPGNLTSYFFGPCENRWNAPNVPCPGPDANQIEAHAILLRIIL